MSAITTDTTRKGILEALESGPYGRCVYHCDNNVVDHQVVNLEFENTAGSDLSKPLWDERKDLIFHKSYAS